MSWALDNPKFLVFNAPLNNNSDNLVSGLTGTWTGESYIESHVGRTAADFDGTDDKIAYGDIYNGVKSVSFFVKSGSTTEQFMELASGIDVDVTTGTIGTTGWTSPTVYVDGEISSTLTSEKWYHVVVASATGINADAVNLGVSGANYGDCSLMLVRFYNTTLTGDEARTLFKRGMIVPKQAKIDQPLDVIPDNTDTSLVGAWLNKSVHGTPNDSSGSGYDGTFSDVIVDKKGALFNGQTGALDMSAASGLDNIFSGGGTWVAWIKSTGVGDNSAGTIFNKWGPHMFLGSPTGGANRLSFSHRTSGTGGTWSTDDRVVYDNEWHHVAVTFDKDSLDNDAILYLNGATPAQNEATTPTGTYYDDSLVTLAVGGGRSTIVNPSNGYAVFEGIIWNARAINEIKSPVWIKNDFLQGVPDADLVFHTMGGTEDLSIYKNTPVYSGGVLVGRRMEFDGTDDKIDWGDIGNVQTIDFWINPGSTTEEILLVDSGNDIMVSSGTITYTGLTASATYVNGVASTTLVADKWQHVVCVFTQIDADNFELGTDGSNFGNIKLEDLRAFDSVKTLGWAKNEYLNNRKYY